MLSQAGAFMIIVRRCLNQTTSPRRRLASMAGVGVRSSDVDRSHRTLSRLSFIFRSSSGRPSHRVDNGGRDATTTSTIAYEWG